MKRQFITYSTGVFASSSPINSTKTSFDQLHIFTRKDAPFAQFFNVCAFWHVTRGTCGHRVTKKRRTPKEICWSSSRTSNNNPVSSFFFRSRPESTPAATVVKHFVTSHSLFCIRAIRKSLIGIPKYVHTLYSAFRQKFPKLWTSVAHSFLQQIAQYKS